MKPARGRGRRGARSGAAPGGGTTPRLRRHLSTDDGDDDVEGGRERELAAAESGMAAAAAAAHVPLPRLPSPKATPPAVALLGAGVVSSAVAQAFAYPLGLVRTRLQVDGAGGRPRVYSSMRHCFSEVRLFFFLSLFFFRFFRVFCLSLPKTCPNKTRKNVQYRSSRERAREASTRASPPT